MNAPLRVTTALEDEALVLPANEAAAVPSPASAEVVALHQAPAPDVERWSLRRAAVFLIGSSCLMWALIIWAAFRFAPSLPF